MTARIVTACPRCDSTDIIRRTNKPGRRTTPDGRYRCEACGATFDDPARRPSKTESYQIRSDSPAAELETADPDALP